MATNKIVEKTAATEVNADFNILVTQKESVNGVQADALRRMPQDVYETSPLPSDIRLAIAFLLNGLRQTQWDSSDRLALLEAWKNEHGTAEVGIKALTNTESFPFNNSVQTVALESNQPSTDYIVMAEVQSSVGNIGEVEITNKLVNGFKLSYTGSASSATIKYIVIGGFTE